MTSSSVTGLSSIVFVSGFAEVDVLTSDGEERETLRDAMGLEDFASAVARHTDADVLISEGLVVPEAREGVVFVGDYTVTEWLLAEAGSSEQVAAHVVSLFLPRVASLQLCEERGLAAAIDIGAYSEWQSDPGHLGGARLIGRRDVAGSVGASCEHPVGDVYCTMSGGAARALPELLVDYLVHHVEALALPDDD